MSSITDNLVKSRTKSANRSPTRKRGNRSRCCGLSNGEHSQVPMSAERGRSRSLQWPNAVDVDQRDVRDRVHVRVGDRQTVAADGYVLRMTDLELFAIGKPKDEQFKWSTGQPSSYRFVTQGASPASTGGVTLPTNILVYRWPTVQTVWTDGAKPDRGSQGRMASSRKSRRNRSRRHFSVNGYVLTDCRDKSPSRGNGDLRTKCTK